jgi:hypothetical protein
LVKIQSDLIIRIEIELPFAFSQEINLSLEWGSAANCSNAMTTLNTIVAKQLDFKKEDALIESKDMKKMMLSLMF